jgi:hypothetical protein
MSRKNLPDVTWLHGQRVDLKTGKVLSQKRKKSSKRKH